MKIRFLNKTGCILLTALLLCFSCPAVAAEKKPPITQYWISVTTENMSIPGMSSEDMSGIEGMMMGRMSGMGPRKSLMLQLNSPKTVPPQPEASHDIPPAQKMGSTLPLIIPERDKPGRSDDEQANYEKPKMRMLMYWGCSDTVRPGQPKVLDTEKMSMIDFGKAMAGRSVSRQYSPSSRAGWVYADWPNRKDRTRTRTRKPKAKKMNRNVKTTNLNMKMKSMKKNRKMKKMMKKISMSRPCRVSSR